MESTKSKASSSSKSSDGGVKDDVDSLKSDFAELKADLMSLIESTLSEGKQSAGHAKEKIEAKFDDTRDTMQHKITENPFTSVGIAAIVGIFLGLFFSRK